MSQYKPATIIFSFQLPICLHLDSNIVFTFDGPEIISLRTEEKLEEHDSRFGSGKGVEISNDTDSAFRFTRISITLEDRNPQLPLDKLTEVYEKKVLVYVNRFIDAYRYVTKRHSIANIQNLNTTREYNVLRDGGDNKKIGLFSVTFGPKGSALSTLLPLRQKEEHDKLQELLNSSPPPLEDLILMDAMRQLKIGHDLEALVSAITALEIALPDTPISGMTKLLTFWKRERPFQARVRDKLIEVGAEKNMIALVVGAIRDRNRIVHEGVREVKTNVEKYLIEIEKAVQLLHK